MKFDPAFFSSLLIFSVLQITLNADAWAEQQDIPDRWFEIEVILFKQLTDKTLLKEQFPDKLNTSTLPNYRQSFDLLNPYLQPSLSQIKQFVPLCGDYDEKHQYLESLQRVTPPFPEQLQLIDQVAIFNMPNFSEESKANEEAKTIDDTILESAQALTHKNSTNQNTSNDNDSDEKNIELSENIILQEGDQTEVVTFEFDLQKKTLAKPIFSTQNLCVITQDEIDNLFDEEQLNGFNLDAFGVDSLPTTLNAAGAHIDDRPYLIADESLVLKDISQRLGWSKEFKPLLHFGWRQVGVTQNKAIPLKLFAGNHLEYTYKKALANYQKEIKEAKAIEKNLLEQLSQAQGTDTEFNQILNKENTINDASLASIDNELKVKIGHKQRALNELFSRINYINNDIDGNAITDIISSIDEQTLEDVISANDVDITIDDRMLDISNPPKEPLQPWFLDGFLKIHLDHYLYITADFNVFNQDQVKIGIEGDEKNVTKLINFSQNRRVITGEIHYFDHPYIGMIVQIRRFDPTKPADEAVTQAIN